MTDPQHAEPDREPVLAAGKLAGAVSGVVLATGGLLKAGGLVLPVDVEQVASEAGNVVLALGVVWFLTGPWLLARLRARDKVTPLVDARDEHGMPLYTDAEVDDLIAKARAAAVEQGYRAAIKAATEQARDEAHAELQRQLAGQVDDPGRHAGDRTEAAR